MKNPFYQTIFCLCQPRDTGPLGAYVGVMNVRGIDVATGSAVELSGFPDPEKLAGAYGFKGRTVESPGDLRPALEAAVKDPGPYLLNVRVSSYENVYPMVPAGAAINEMVFGPPQPVAV